MAPLWFMPLLLAFGAAVNGFVGVRLRPTRFASAVAVAPLAGAFGLAVLAIWRLRQLPVGVVEITQVLGDWIPPLPVATQHGPTGILTVPWGLRLDSLAAILLLAVTGTGAAVQLSAAVRMAHEPREHVARVLCLLNLLCCFMVVLILGSTFLMMLAGWEGVGLCSYLLIGGRYGGKSVANAGARAFITSRVGDWAFILGITLVFFTFGTLDVRAVQDAAAAMPVESAAWGVLSTIAALLVAAAFGKSAQVPLHAWLADAIERPTLASAVLLAAAMVTAGGYVVGRNAVLFAQTPMVAIIGAVVCVVTVLLGVAIGLASRSGSWR